MAELLKDAFGSEGQKHIEQMAVRITDRYFKAAESDLKNGVTTREMVLKEKILDDNGCSISTGEILQHQGFENSPDGLNRYFKEKLRTDLSVEQKLWLDDPEVVHRILKATLAKALANLPDEPEWWHTDLVISEEDSALRDILPNHPRLPDLCSLWKIRNDAEAVLRYKDNRAGGKPDPNLLNRFE